MKGTVFVTPYGDEFVARLIDTTSKIVLAGETGLTPDSAIGSLVRTTLHTPGLPSVEIMGVRFDYPPTPDPEPPTCRKCGSTHIVLEWDEDEHGLRGQCFACWKKTL